MDFLRRMRRATMWSCTRMGRGGRCWTRVHFLRQQTNREGSEPCRSLADFIAPKETGLDGYDGRVRGDKRDGAEGVVRGFRAAHDDYNAIMAEAIADRLAEAFAECLHKRVRDEWGYGCAENLSSEDLVPEKYRGIRPAPGYPACPDHTEKGTIWRLLDVKEKAGIELTESFAMWPGSSVSGFYFAHPEIAVFPTGQDRPRPGGRLCAAQRHERSGKLSAGWGRI